MRNKYMQRGLTLLAGGIILNAAGLIMKAKTLEFYGWVMIAGTIFFGLGFILIVYSLIRKVERQAILEERHARPENEQ